MLGDWFVDSTLLDLLVEAGRLLLYQNLSHFLAFCSSQTQRRSTEVKSNRPLILLQAEDRLGVGEMIYAILSKMYWHNPYSDEPLDRHHSKHTENELG